MCAAEVDDEATGDGGGDAVPFRSTNCDILSEKTQRPAAVATLVEKGFWFRLLMYAVPIDFKRFEDGTCIPETAPRQHKLSTFICGNNLWQ